MRTDLLAEKIVCLQPQIHINAVKCRLSHGYCGYMAINLIAFACRNEVPFINKQAKM